jgi:hypothetical protein
MGLREVLARRRATERLRHEGPDERDPQTATVEYASGAAGPGKQALAATDDHR